MKSALKRLIAIAALSTVLAAGNAIASPRVETIGARAVWTETATGGADGNASIVISAARANAVRPGMWFQLGGRDLYKLISIPGTADVQPGTGWTIAVVDAIGRSIVAPIARSDTTTETIEGYETTSGMWEPIIRTWIIPLTGIGAGNQVTVEVVFD